MLAFVEEHSKTPLWNAGHSPLSPRAPNGAWLSFTAAVTVSLMLALHARDLLSSERESEVSLHVRPHAA